MAAKRSRSKRKLDEQYTPSSFFGPLNREFRFTMDPCATAESAKCKAFYTKKDNGLSRPWSGRVWLNPPYSNIGAWLAKAIEELKSGRVTKVVALLPAWTDRKWWHLYVEPARDAPHGPKVRFVKGRVVFGCPGNPQGKKRGSGTFPSVVVIWRKPRRVRLQMADPRQLSMDWLKFGC